MHVFSCLTVWLLVCFKCPDLQVVICCSQVLGAFWYLISLERETTCWKQACGNSTICTRRDLYCDTGGRHPDKTAFLNSSCPILVEDKEKFDFGIFLDGLQSGIVESKTDFPQKFFYCFWWGLRNLRCTIQLRIVELIFLEIRF